tara:strand:+ start:11693 stop:12241 length:549 start_codon:yes stop_codon:yes gene_type:complete
MSTKKKLILSAITILNEDPSSNLDVIAKKADVSRRTLHRYFTSREAMIQACCESIVGSMLADVEEAIKIHTSPLDQLKKMFEDDLAKGQHLEFCQKFTDEFTDEEILVQFRKMGELFNNVLDKLKSKKLIDPTLSNDWLSYVWIGMIRTTNQALTEGVIAPKMANNLGWNAFINGVIIQKNK